MSISRLPCFEGSEHPLRNRDFIRLCIGNVASWVGDQFYFIALPWLILEITDSGFVLGTITMLSAIPRAALMLMGGVATDRFSPRKIMLVSAGSRALLLALVAGLDWIHLLQVPYLYALALAFGIADAFASPAELTYLPSIVGVQQLPTANAVIQFTAQIAELVTPLIAGLFVTTCGTAWAILLDAVGFVLMIAALWRLPDPKVDYVSRSRSNIVRSIVDGLLYVKRDVALRSILLVIATLNFTAGGPLVVGIAFIAKQRFGTPASFGLLASVLAVGGLIGTLLAGLTKCGIRGSVLLIVDIVIGSCLIIIGSANHLAAVAFALFVIAGAAAFVEIQLITWIQQRVDSGVRGRVMSVVTFCAVALSPLSYAVSGMVISWSLSGLFLISGTLVLTVTLLLCTQRSVREIYLRQKSS